MSEQSAEADTEAVTDPDTGIVYFPDDPTPNPYGADHPDYREEWKP